MPSPRRCPPAASAGSQRAGDQAPDLGPAERGGGQAVVRQDPARVGVVEVDVVAQVVAVALESEVQASLDRGGAGDGARGRIDEREAAHAQPGGDHSEHDLLAGRVGDHEVKGCSRAFREPSESEQAPRDVAHGDDVEARAARGGDAQLPGGAGSGIGQGGGHADELEQQVCGRPAGGVRRQPHHGARTKDSHIEAVAPPGAAHGGLGLQLDAFVGIVEVLADVAIAPEHRARAPATDIRGRELGPGREAAAGQSPRRPSGPRRPARKRSHPRGRRSSRPRSGSRPRWSRGGGSRRRRRGRRRACRDLPSTTRLAPCPTPWWRRRAPRPSGRRGGQEGHGSPR